MNHHRSNRNAFTLVELLVAIVISGIISSMVAVALSGASRQAQETRARTFIEKLNLSMLRVYENEARRRLGSLQGRPASGEALGQSQLIYKREWLRAVLPNNRADLTVRAGVAGPTQIPFIERTAAGTFVSNPTADFTINAMTDRYRQRVYRSVSLPATAPANSPMTAAEWNDALTRWTPQFESAECLYLIFSANTLNGRPLTEQLRTRDVTDQDEDGMPEIVDPWGVPVLWMRWPVGFYLKNRWVPDESVAAQWPTVGELRSVVGKLGEDPMDVLRGDPRQADAATAFTGLADNYQINPAVDDNSVFIDKQTFFVQPLIISAGSDGEFDLFTNVGTGRETTGDDYIRFSDHGFAANVPFAGTVSYGTVAFFPDPFSSLQIVDPGGAAVSGVRPLIERLGAVTDVDGDRTDDSADNVYPSLGI